MAPGRFTTSNAVVNSATTTAAMCQLPRRGSGFTVDGAATHSSARLTFGVLAYRADSEGFRTKTPEYAYRADHPDLALGLAP